MDIASTQSLVDSLRAKAKPPSNIKVDPLFIEDPKAAKIIEHAIKRRQNLLLYGPTGCGKSCLAINVMARLNETAEIFSCSGETSIDELIGKPWVVSENGCSITICAYGAALRAYKYGRGLLIEEMDFALPTMLGGLHRIMETNSSTYVCNIGMEEIIQRSPNYFVIATANTIGTGEDSVSYTGTQPLNMAFMNRFSYTYKLDYLDPAKEVIVLEKKTGISHGIAEKMVQVAKDMRDAADPTRIGGLSTSQTITTAISTRDLLAWADLVVANIATPKEAARYAFLNRTNSADRDVITTAVDNMFR